MSYRYVIDVRRDDGELLLQTTVTPNWAPVLEWVHFEGVRQGVLPAVMADASGHVDPIWHPELGEPYVSAFRAVIPSAVEVTREIPRAYLHPVAQKAASGLVQQHVLKPGEAFRYVVTAFSRVETSASPEPEEFNSSTSDAVSTGDADFVVEALEQSLPLHDGCLAGMKQGAISTSGRIDGEVPVFVPRLVLDEAVAQARAAGDVESGGILVGKLCRDTAGPEIFVEVTAYIRAEHALAQSTKLTFTAESWAAARDALALRKRNEAIVGWAHHHPSFCRLRGCPLERRRTCAASSAFFSAEDIHLHATCFPRAFHIALLVSESIDDFTCSLYGWRWGMVAARGFYVVSSQ